MIGHCGWNLFIFPTPAFLDSERTGHPCQYTWTVAARAGSLYFLLKAFFLLRE